MFASWESLSLLCSAEIRKLWGECCLSRCESGGQGGPWSGGVRALDSNDAHLLSFSWPFLYLCNLSSVRWASLVSLSIQRNLQYNSVALPLDSLSYMACIEWLQLGAYQGASAVLWVDYCLHHWWNRVNRISLFIRRCTEPTRLIPGKITFDKF